MGWGFRKSFGTGAFRVNLSKSGVGFSTGVKGFRVSTNSRGTFVSVGSNGIYYRQKIGGPARQSGRGSSRVGASQPFSHPSQQAPGFQAVQTADAASLVDQRSEQLLSAINETISQPGTLRILLPIAVVTTILTSLAAPWLPFATALVWLGPLVYASRFDAKNKTYSLLFELDPPDELRWQRISSVLARFATSQAMWRIAANAHTTDWKRNAGAQTLLDRKRTVVAQKNPPFLSTNVAAWCIDASDQKLYFMPDRLYVYQNGRYGAVEYDSLSAAVTGERFIESGHLPGDAVIVGSTYQYVNKDGSPDRRFANNRQIPIVEYARAVLASPSGLNIHLHVSSMSAAQMLSGLHVATQRQAGTQTSSPRPGTSSGSRSNVKSAPFPKPYVVLGLRPGCTRDEAFAAYRALAKKYHPDLLTKLPPDLASIGEERMKEINVAFTEVRRLNGW